MILAGLLQWFLAVQGWKVLTMMSFVVTLRAYWKNRSKAGRSRIRTENPALDDNKTLHSEIKYMGELLKPMRTHNTQTYIDASNSTD